MAEQNAVGPYESFPLANGGAVPFYLITFDKEGHCQSPLTLAALLSAVQSGTYTDVHVFSHGWNNVFKDAVRLYRTFFGNYFGARDERGLNDPANYRPVAVGIIWPSTLLVLPWESTPRIAGAAPGAKDEAAEADRTALDDVANVVRPVDRVRLYQLAERGANLSPAEALDLARVLLPVYQQSSGQPSSAPEVDCDKVTSVDMTAERLLSLWQTLAPSAADDTRAPRFAPDNGVSASGEDVPRAAGLLGWLDPRNPIRVASLLLMKDRAGTVGARGVGPELTQKLLSFKKARIHLIGHSFGAKVMLSSLCCAEPAALAASVLLLEPAISYLCFAQAIDGVGVNGGYRAALDRVQQPIFSTFSASDVPLRRLFHLAVIRESDWGEKKIAGGPPNRFAALGGYGPGGLAAGQSKTIAMPAPGTKYPSNEPGIRIFGVDGSQGQITGHGDVATKFTAWAHLNLVSGQELR
jgi:hypothetical protein